MELSRLKYMAFCLYIYIYIYGIATRHIKKKKKKTKQFSHEQDLKSIVTWFLTPREDRS